MYIELPDENTVGRLEAALEKSITELILNGVEGGNIPRTHDCGNQQCEATDAVLETQMLVRIQLSYN